MRRLKKTARSALARLLQHAPLRLQTYFKRRTEIAYWAERQRVEGDVTSNNRHFKEAFLSTFGLEETFPDGKRMLDVGCGPRGSLEWATTAKERVGLDPLADKYRTLGIDRHAMRYVNAPSEAVPFPDQYFDVVSSFNSLDHVENVETSLGEMIRVLRRGGDLLIMVEINHPPTLAEPHSIRSTDVLSLPMDIISSQNIAIKAGQGIYVSLRNPVILGSQTTEPAYFCARLRRR